MALAVAARAAAPIVAPQAVVVDHFVVVVVVDFVVGATRVAIGFESAAVGAAVPVAVVPMPVAAALGKCRQGLR